MLKLIMEDWELKGEEVMLIMEEQLAWVVRELEDLQLLVQEDRLPLVEVVVAILLGEVVVVVEEELLC